MNLPKIKYQESHILIETLESRRYRSGGDYYTYTSMSGYLVDKFVTQIWREFQVGVLNVTHEEEYVVL